MWETGWRGRPLGVTARPTNAEHLATCFFFFFHLPQVGKWSASGGLNITEVPKRKGMNITDSLANRSLVISTILVGQMRGKKCPALHVSSLSLPDDTLENQAFARTALS